MENDKVKLLMDLKKAKDELISALSSGLDDDKKYNNARKKYEEYKRLYTLITNEEPKNTFESLEDAVIE